MCVSRDQVRRNGLDFRRILASPSQSFHAGGPCPVPRTGHNDRHAMIVSTLTSCSARMLLYTVATNMATYLL